MNKCTECNKKAKQWRTCPALNKEICSTCCGTKRGREIKCLKDCNYYIEGLMNDNKKIVMKLVRESFNKQSEDIYGIEEVVMAVQPFEMFVFQNFYDNRKFNDGVIFDCFMKMYCSRENDGEIYNYSDDELRIVDEFNRITTQKKVSIQLQSTILLRLMKTVSNMTGGMFGNRMYFELLRGQFDGTGIVAPML